MAADDPAVAWLIEQYEETLAAAERYKAHIETAADRVRLARTSWQPGTTSYAAGWSASGENPPERRSFLWPSWPSSPRATTHRDDGPPDDRVPS